jgi:type IV secretory pathway VirB4 component
VEGRVGKVQEQNLYNAIVTAFEEHRPYPDFNIINEELLNITDGKADSITSILRPIIEQKYLVSNKQHKYETWTDRTLVIDIHEIEKKNLVCFMVLNQIHQELKKLGVAPFNEESKARHIRTVIVIDEAHYFLSNPKQAKILQNMIRDVRSAGGAIVLASQSPDDYDKADFDFLEQMEFPVVLKSSPKSHKFLEQKFGLSSKEAKKMLGELSSLERGQAFVKDESLKLVELTK